MGDLEKVVPLDSPPYEGSEALVIPRDSDAKPGFSTASELVDQRTQ